MSRNLHTSSCCGNIVRLEDLRGKPLEFRRYAREPVVIGTKWVCPSCNNAYFAWWRDAQVGHGGVVLKGFSIDLSYYDTFEDEPAREPVAQPKHLCLDNAEDIQKVL